MHKTALIAAFAAMLPAWSAAAESPARTVSVSGSAHISLAPDMARAHMGVRSEAESAAEALAANSADMQSVVAALKESGVAPKDIRTSGFAVGPVTRWGQTQSGEREQKLIGYFASNQVTATVRDVGALGAVLDAAARSGANQINNVSFEASKFDKALDAARGDALEDARRKAMLYAQAGGARLGPVISISEGGYAGGPPTGYATRAMESAAAPPPIEAGEQTYSVTVQVVWSLENAE